MNGRISVIIPCFNSASTILKCLEALENQSVNATEIIVVDDGSTDETKQLLQQHKNIRLVDNCGLRGPGGARNAGALVARGDILVFIDSDCIPPRDWLEKLSNAFIHESVGAAGGGYCSGVDESFWQVFSHLELAFRRRNWDGPVRTLVSNNLACRKSVFEKVGGFPDKYTVCEDMLFSFRISEEFIVLWLKDCSVKHHFKNSVADFLSHQYNFARESTIFFIENVRVLVAGNHQGRSLHMSMACALLIQIAFIAMFASTLNWPSKTAWILGGVCMTLLLMHLILNFPFIRYLRNMKFRKTFRGYLAILSRDIVCSIAFLEGCYIHLRNMLMPRSRSN